MLCRLLPLLLLAGWLRAGTLDKLEQDFNAGHFSDVIKQAERLQHASKNPDERAAACRLAALAHNMRLEFAESNAWLVEAVVQTPDQLSNPALLADYTSNLNRRGLQPGTLQELARLAEVVNDRPDLRWFYRRLRALAEAQQGQMARADSLLAAARGLGEFWLAGPFANMAASGLRRLEDVEAGVFDSTATWEDQSGLPCRWRRIQAEGSLVDLDMLQGGKPDGCPVLLTHVRSPQDQPARLLLSGSGQFRVQVNGAGLPGTAQLAAGDPGRLAG